jgi:hypothetical protein
MGCETDAKPGATTIGVAPGLGVNPGLGLGVNPGLDIYKRLLDYYEPLHFDPVHITITIVDHTTHVLRTMGLKEICDIQQVGGVYIYPSEYFNPTNIITHRLHITANTRSIHHYAASWEDKKECALKTIFRSILPERFLLWYNGAKRRFAK